MARWIPELEWDEENEDHIARHDVTREEVEEARGNAEVFRRSGNDRYYFIGRTDVGRVLFVVIALHGYVITARSADATERRLCRRKGKG